MSAIWYNISVSFEYCKFQGMLKMKIVIIGGGSVLWTPRLGCDLLLEPSLNGSEMCLVDIDPQAAALCAAYLKCAVKQHKLRWSITVSGMDKALKGADLVLVSISTGGFEAMSHDITIPEKYGIYHSVGDTVGPGGISRTLRNVPVFLEIARKMNRFCPDAWLIHVTNPLNQLTRAVEKSGLIQTVGMCHEYTGIMNMLQKFFKLDKRSDIDSLCIGVNHFTVLKNLKVKGVRDPEAQLTLDNYFAYEQEHSGELLAGTIDDAVIKASGAPGKTIPYYFNFYVKEKWGFFPMASSCHICESIPGCNISPENLANLNIYRKDVLPGRPQRKAERTQKIADILKSGNAVPEMALRSNEMFCDAAVGLLTGEPRRIIAAMRNCGQAADLPQDVTVETWALASRCGINPVASGKIPPRAKGLMEQIIMEEELTVEAAMTGNFDTLIAALHNSPMVHDKSVVVPMAKELLQANKKYLPQFNI